MTIYSVMRKSSLSSTPNTAPTPAESEWMQIKKEELHQKYLRREEKQSCVIILKEMQELKTPWPVAVCGRTSKSDSHPAHLASTITLQAPLWQIPWRNSMCNSMHMSSPVWGMSPVWGSNYFVYHGRGGAPSFASNEVEGMRGARTEQDLGPLEAVSAMSGILQGPVDQNSTQKHFQGKKVLCFIVWQCMRG